MALHGTSLLCFPSPPLRDARGDDHAIRSPAERNAGKQGLPRMGVRNTRGANSINRFGSILPHTSMGTIWRDTYKSFRFRSGSETGGFHKPPAFAMLMYTRMLQESSRRGCFLATQRPDLDLAARPETQDSVPALHRSLRTSQLEGKGKARASWRPLATLGCRGVAACVASHYG